MRITVLQRNGLSQVSFKGRVLALLAMAALVMAAYLLIARPYQSHWGATPDEVDCPMPGDSLDLHPTFLATRSITIHGRPEGIWPWLIQMGYGRAGFYGYEIFDHTTVNRRQWIKQLRNRSTGTASIRLSVSPCTQ